MRGIILSDTYEGGRNSLSVQVGTRTEKIRQSILYWDKIDVPDNNLLGTSISADEQFLESEGILQRTLVNFNAENGIMINADLLNTIQNAVLGYNNKNSGEVWTLGQYSKSLILPKEQGVETETIQIELCNCLPVPDQDTPFENILKFKEQRQDELNEFRKVLDDMYDSILKSGNPELSKNRSIEKLQNKLILIDRLMNESKMHKMMSNVKIKLNASSMVHMGVNALSIYGAGKLVGLPDMATTFGVLASTLVVSYEKSMKPKEIPDSIKDYAYLFYAKRDVL